MELILQPFTLGTSTVVTLPKKWGVTPPAKLKAKKTGKRITLEVISEQNRIQKNVALAKKLMGGFTGKFNLTPAQLKRYYELGTYGRTWK